MTPQPAYSPRQTPAFRRKYLSFQSVFAVEAALIALSVAKGFIGAGPIRAYTHDSWVFLDGAWRIMNGQLPHRDFYSALGFLCYMPTLIGLQFSRGASAINWGQCLLGCVITLLSVPLVLKRMRQPFSVLYCVALTVITISPFSIGEFFTVGTQAVFYNRMGYALLGIILAECACPSGDERPWGSEFRGGLLIGSIIGFAFFLKFTVAVFGLLLIFTTIPVRPQSRGRWLGMGSSILIAVTAGLAYLQFNVSALLGDLHRLSLARRVGFLHLFGKPLQNVPQLVTVGAFFCFVVFALHYLGSSSLARKWGWIFLVSLGIDVGSLGTNTYRQPAGFPFTALAILVLLSDIDRVLPLSDGFRIARRAVLAWGLSIALIAPMMDVAGLLHVAVRTIIQPHRFASVKLNTPVGDDMTMVEFLNPDTGANSLVEEVNDGLALLERYSTPADKIGAFCYANPFPYWLKRAPMAGGTPTYDYGSNYNEKSGPTPEEAFGPADVVLVPRLAEDGLPWASTPPLIRIYKPYVDANFTKVAETRYWWLYRKNSGSPKS